MFLDYRATGLVLSSMHADTLALADSAAASAMLALDHAATDLPCPTCRAPMRRMHIPGSAVDVDRCDDHGTWFDRAELRQVAEQVARTRGRPVASAGTAAAVAGGAVLAAGAGAGAAMAMSEDRRQRVLDAATEGTELAIDGAEVAVDGTELAIDGAAAAAEGAGVALDLLGAAAELLGEIFSGL